jgi:hypothetical protein
LLIAGAGLTGHHRCGIAGRKADQEEVHHDDRKQDEHALHDPLGNE